jgi:hypothetical protein
LIALDPDSPFAVDSRQFEDQIAAGHLAQTAALYKADCLDGSFLDNSPTFEQWALLEHERQQLLLEEAFATVMAQSLSQVGLLHSEPLWCYAEEQL